MLIWQGFHKAPRVVKIVLKIKLLSLYLCLQAFYRQSWMQGPADENGTRTPFCMRGLANYSTAVSVAFELDGEWLYTNPAIKSGTVFVKLLK